MTEHEKAVIELLKQTIDFNIDIYTDQLNDDDIETILNLTEKQQNKIASLEKQIKLMQSDDRISKDKIRDKIKELNELKLCGDDFFNLITDDKIYLLNELLGEKDE